MKLFIVETSVEYIMGEGKVRESYVEAKSFKEVEDKVRGEVISIRKLTDNVIRETEETKNVR